MLCLENGVISVDIMMGTGGDEESESEEDKILSDDKSRVCTVFLVGVVVGVLICDIGLLLDVLVA